MFKRLFLLGCLPAFSLPLAHAQSQRLPTPANVRFDGSELHWNAVQNAYGYQIFWRPSGQRWLNATVYSPTTSARLPGLPYDTSTQMMVRALGSSDSGFRNSTFSSRITGIRQRATTIPPIATAAPPASTSVPLPSNTPLPTSPPVPTNTPLPPTLIPLEAPSNLRAVNSDTIAWDLVTGAVWYRVSWREVSSSKRYLDIHDNHSLLQYTLPYLKPGTDYAVRVLAGGDFETYADVSPWSDEFTLKRAPTPTPRPTATDTPYSPDALPAPTIRATSETSIAWDDVPGAVIYEIIWTDENGDWNAVEVLFAPATSFAIKNMRVGIAYQIRVRAIGDASPNMRDSAWSNIVTLRIKPTSTPVPPTDTPTPPPTDTPTNTPTDTPTNTPTDTSTNTPVPPTATPTPSPTPEPKALPYPRNLRNSLFAVSWDPVDGAVKYGVHVRSSVGDHPIRYVSGTSYDIPDPHFDAYYFVHVQSRGDGQRYAVNNEFSPYWSFVIQPTNTLAPTDTPTPTATPIPTDTSTPIPPPGPVRNLEGQSSLTDAISVDWDPPSTGASYVSSYRVEYIDPWGDDWTYAANTTRTQYYENRAGWSGEFRVRVRPESAYGNGPWREVSVWAA